jgi:predicted nucleic acid-binding protein
MSKPYEELNKDDMIIVSNAGPIIALARIGKLDLLKQFMQIYIPNEVYEQVVVKGEGKPGSTEVKDSDWFITKEVKNKLAVESLTIELEKGEAETIILALELNAWLVLIDESIARDIAKSRGLEVIGTVGILAEAYERGVIKDLKKSLDDLRSKRVWISEKVYNRVLSGIKGK